MWWQYYIQEFTEKCFDPSCSFVCGPTSCFIKTFLFNILVIMVAVVKKTNMFNSIRPRRMGTAQNNSTSRRRLFTLLGRILTTISTRRPRFNLTTRFLTTHEIHEWVLSHQKLTENVWDRYFVVFSDILKTSVSFSRGVISIVEFCGVVV